MIQKFNDDDEYSSGIGPVKTPDHSIPSKRDFKPWHKPRKHWLRLNQWAVQARKFIEEVGNPQKVLTYLTLPGTDMLDVRIMCDECAKFGYIVKYLGFNDPGESVNNHQAELSISQSELSQNGGAHKDSFVVLDKFEALANENKVAYQKMVDFGSFDVVNLDLCNSMAGYIPLQQQENYFEALARLVEFQSNNRTKPWLFFVTTRVDKKSVKEEALSALLTCVGQNISDHKIFRDKLGEEFSLDQTLVTNAINKKKLSDRQLYDAFGVGLGKWLLHYLQNGEPRWTLEMLPSWSYHVMPNSKVPDMVSFAFKCIPIQTQRVDRSKMTERRPLKSGVSPYSELAAALKLLSNLKDMQDLDKILEDDIKLMASMVEAAAVFMERARYDRVAYISEFGIST